MGILNLKIYRAVFLDRDGTIAKDGPYCSCPEDFELLPGVAEGIRLLNEHGFKVIVITNQSGIARGYFTEEMLAKIHDKMRSELAKYGAHIDGIYYCPHHPDEGCDCRKPKPTLILKAAQEHDIDLAKSFLIGDKPQDIEAGHLAGCKTILVCPGGEESASKELPVAPSFVVENFEKATNWIAKATGTQTPDFEVAKDESAYGIIDGLKDQQTTKETTKEWARWQLPPE